MWSNDVIEITEYSFNKRKSCNIFQVWKLLHMENVYNCEVSINANALGFNKSVKVLKITEKLKVLLHYGY